MNIFIKENIIFEMEYNENTKNNILISFYNNKNKKILSNIRICSNIIFIGGHCFKSDDTHIWIAKMVVYIIRKKEKIISSPAQYLLFVIFKIKLNDIKNTFGDHAEIWLNHINTNIETASEPRNDPSLKDIHWLNYELGLVENEKDAVEICAPFCTFSVSLCNHITNRTTK